jgi:acetyl esterase/lipase
MISKDYTYKTFASDRPILATVHFDETVNSSKPRPIAIHIHGGGFTIGTRLTKPSAPVEYLTRHGLVVVSIDHRFTPNISLADGPIADCRSAYQWVHDSLPSLLQQQHSISADGDRIVVFGMSAGGFLTLTLGAGTAPRPKALLSFYGPQLTMSEFYKQPVDLPIPDFPDSFIDRVFDEPVISNSAEQPANKAKDPATGLDARMAWVLTKIKQGKLINVLMGDDVAKLDPAANFDGSYPPTYFAQGGQDKLVNVNVVHQGYEKLKAAGVETELGIWAEGGHDFDEGVKEGEPAWNEVIVNGLDFLIKHV